MSDRTETEILVVGAGPAGLAAAVAASSKGHSVVMVDENPAAGGQIWRQMGTAPNSATERRLAQLFRAKVQILAPATVFDFPNEGTASIAYRGGSGTVRFQKAILCTGARERFLPFPGWTLPGVFGVGGFQALVKQGLPIRGKHVVVAGSGPLLLAVAKHLGKHGAKIQGIFEQAEMGGMRKLTIALWKYPSKLRQAISFLGTVQRLKPEWWVSRALGSGALEAAEVTNGTKTRRVDCDYLACAFGLVPNVELAQIAGCRIGDGFVEVDEFQRTSNPRVFCAGEPVAIGGVEAAIVQGTIAGLAAAGDEDRARHYFKERVKAAEFAKGLATAFGLRREVLELAEAETIVCRCEDVRFGELNGFKSARDAKMQTRVGMGPCQGRICGPACQAVFGWETPTVRPPLTPVPVFALLDAPDL